MSSKQKKERRRCFFDITIDGRATGRIVFELFDDVAPVTCENFLKLCTGEAGVGKTTGKPLHYKGTLFHRVIKNFMIQAGDFSAGNGTGGESIYGGMFDDEEFVFKHDEPFLLSMANKGKNTNGSQFFITTKPAPHLDGIHVVFGRVLDGTDVVTEIEKLKVNQKSRPFADVIILNCGQLVKKSKRKYSESEESEAASESESEKQKKKRAKRDSDEENKKQTVTAYSTVRKEDLPEEPENAHSFLMRRSQTPEHIRQERKEKKEAEEKEKKKERKRDGRDRSRSRRETERRDRYDRERDSDRSKEKKIKIKGRGALRFNPEMFKRERERTPPHWKREEQRLVKLSEYEKMKETQSKAEVFASQIKVENDENGSRLAGKHSPIRFIKPTSPGVEDIHDEGVNEEQIVFEDEVPFEEAATKDDVAEERDASKSPVVEEVQKSRSPSPTEKKRADLSSASKITADNNEDGSRPADTDSPDRFINPTSPGTDDAQEEDLNEEKGEDHIDEAAVKENPLDERDGSKSPVAEEAQKSRSPSPVAKKREDLNKDRSESPAPRDREHTKSPTPQNREDSKSPGPRDRESSKSPAPCNRERSKSPGHRDRVRSKSPGHRERRRSKSPAHQDRPSPESSFTAAFPSSSFGASSPFAFSSATPSLTFSNLQPGAARRHLLNGAVDPLVETNVLRLGVVAVNRATRLLLDVVRIADAVLALRLPATARRLRTSTGRQSIATRQLDAIKGADRSWEARYSCKSTGVMPPKTAPSDNEGGGEEISARRKKERGTGKRNGKDKTPDNKTSKTNERATKRGLSGETRPPQKPKPQAVEQSPNRACISLYMPPGVSVSEVPPDGPRLTKEQLRPIAMKWVKRTLEKGIEGLRMEFAAQKKPVDPALMKEFIANWPIGKNRYKDVGCLDETRVVLNPKSANSDYIHANFVSTPQNKKRFICTQGPLDTTVSDFWRMVLQERSSIILMLCNIIEKGMKKCSEYWPQKPGEKISFENITVLNVVTKMHELPMESASKVQIRITGICIYVDDQRAHMVDHIQWVDWPDRGVPPCDLTAIALLNQIRRTVFPIIVHCSAGIGRTGSIVMLEYMLERLMVGEDIENMDVLLTQLRNQRAYSIQTDQQYLYIHRIMLEYFVKKSLIPLDLGPYLAKFIGDYNKYCEF
ncbi:hypothetical protein QR680_018516 [Steinernema hermaphroditum]|uniref:peptidylprolyl isomerase n=1 Tax=Steinernema hermaphroditum TaxID=289476 RepID=A0AA39HI77_9BILA|nr:hypothetical protein QR680_018516 [Steinernema hermaphroditum]